MGVNVKLVTIFAIAALGGVLGCLLMIPIRKFLIKDEHGKLPYPEGTACAEVIVAGKEGGTTSKMPFKGIGIGGILNSLLTVSASFLKN